MGRFSHSSRVAFVRSGTDIVVEGLAVNSSQKLHKFFRSWLGLAFSCSLQINDSLFNKTPSYANLKDT